MSIKWEFDIEDDEIQFGTVLCVKSCVSQWYLPSGGFNLLSFNKGRTYRFEMVGDKYKVIRKVSKEDRYIIFGDNDKMIFKYNDINDFNKYFKIK